MCAFYKNVYYTFDKAINFQTDRFLRKEYVTAMQIRLPVGIENFKRIYTEGCYYVDKTGLIRDLLQNMTYVYASETVWKNHEHEYAETFFETDSDVQYTDRQHISCRQETDKAGMDRRHRRADAPDQSNG